MHRFEQLKGSRPRSEDPGLWTDGGIEEAVHLLSMVKRINDWELENFPVPTTHAGRELFLNLAMSCVGNAPQAMKILHGDAVYSSSGLRKTLRQMEDAGWLVRQRALNDGRCRTLVPSSELSFRIGGYVGMLQQVFRATEALVSIPDSSVPGLSLGVE